MVKTTALLQDGMSVRNAANINELKFGCPEWSNPLWSKLIYSSNLAKTQSLNAYSALFNSVEGNTSFYHLPSSKTVQQWSEMVPDRFRFTFKFPQTISHQGLLCEKAPLILEALNRFSMLEHKLGCLMLQLPSRYSPDYMSDLATFIQTLPKEFNYAIEVRHLAFFDKSEHEKRFNQLLIEHQVNRIIMDTRGLFSCQSEASDLVRDVQTKKPKVPTNVIATAKSPIIRFVGHPNIDSNRQFLAPWMKKINDWREQGIHPYLFFHMPDNSEAPWLAKAFFNWIQDAYPQHSWPNLNLPSYHSNQLDIFSAQ